MTQQEPVHTNANSPELRPCQQKQSVLRDIRKNLRKEYNFTSLRPIEETNAIILTQATLLLPENGKEFFGPLNNHGIGEDFMVALLAITGRNQAADRYLERYTKLRKDVSDYLLTTDRHNLIALNLSDERVYIFGEALLFWQTYLHAQPQLSLKEAYTQICMAPAVAIFNHIQEVTAELDAQELVKAKIAALEIAKTSFTHTRLTEEIFKILNGWDQTLTAYQAYLIPSYLRKLALDFEGGEKDYYLLAQACIHIEYGIKELAKKRLAERGNEV